MTCKAMIRTGHVAVKYNDCMLVWGGYKEGENFEILTIDRYLPGEDLWVYDPSIERWFVRKCHGNIPPGTSGCCAVVIQDNFYLFGGYREFGNTNDLFVLNLITLEWKIIDHNDPIPIPSDKLVGWEYEGKLYYFGGFGFEPDYRSASNSQRARDFRCVLDPQIPNQFRRGWNNQLICFDPAIAKWCCPKYKGDAPVARAAHAVSVVKNKVYIFGGRHQRFRMNDLHILDMETMEWSGKVETKGKKPPGRSWHSLTALTDDTLVLYGGFSQLNEALDDCWLLNLKNFEWTQLNLPFSRKRLWHSACMALPGEIVICGGCCGNILEQLSHEHTPELVILRFTPKSLFRLSLDTVLQYHLTLEQYFDILPASIMKVINLRLSAKRNSQSETNTLNGS